MSLASLAGRVAIVTGAGRGSEGVSIGFAIAYVLAREGAGVAAVDLDPKAADRTAAAIATEFGAPAITIIADVTREADCSRIVGETVEHFGHIDILVNSVGITAPGQIPDVTEHEFDRVLAVNLKAAFFMTRYATQAMTTGGAIVNLSSIAAGARPSLRAAYSTSKAALEALTRVTALQFGGQGVRANAVAPGEVWTPFVDRNYENDRLRAAAREEKRLRSVLMTEGTALDIAEVAVFLAGDRARWITGQVITVDGGSGLRMY